MTSSKTTSKANENKNASATKSGPGRFHVQGKPGDKLAKARPVRAYRALMAAWAAKRVTKASHRDEQGAYTLVGRTRFVPDVVFHGVVMSSKTVPANGRRMWLAGISSQRGY